jgi:hypothetical protein
MRRASGRCGPAWIRTETQLFQLLAVHIGARVAPLAAPSAMIVSQTVKDLVAGSGLTFEDSGEHEFKGVPGLLAPSTGWWVDRARVSRDPYCFTGCIYTRAPALAACVLVGG